MTPIAIATEGYVKFGSVEDTDKSALPSDVRGLSTSVDRGNAIDLEISSNTTSIENRLAG